MQRNLLDHIQEPVWIRDCEGNICFTNRAFREMTNFQEKNNIVDPFNETTQCTTDETEAIFQKHIYTVV
ncbi:MAG: PAS domain-containing protein, partial [Bartonella sp.]|nr:PAS domain-containing protein [Bartonella sp.]